MKILVGLLFFVSAGAYAADSASCRLEQLIYSTQDYVNYQFEGKDLLSEKTVRLLEHQNILADVVSPVSYSVVVSTGFEGSLCLQVDQPGPCDHGSRSDAHDPLTLAVEETYNGGKTRYVLSCQLD